MCVRMYIVLYAVLFASHASEHAELSHTHTLDSAMSKETKDLTGPSSASTMHAELHITAMYAEKSSVFVIK